MNGVKAFFAKNGRCPRSQALVEENSLHATRSEPSSSSSTAAAA
jgi:hypothetical protein